jgi:hypothetical protein
VDKLCAFFDRMMVAEFINRIRSIIPLNFFGDYRATRVVVESKDRYRFVYGSHKSYKL